MSKKLYILFTCILGNALEFYNFVIYGAFAFIIGPLYFPSQNPTVSLLSTLGVFASGFIMRPFGAIIIGYIGDKIGRKKALSISIMLMAIPSFVIGILPDYSNIGFFAPFLMIVCRLVQGISAGGEYNGAAIFALEHIGKRHPGFTGGLIGASCVLGAIMATFLAKFLSQFGSDLANILWRIPFLFGGTIGFLGFYMRRSISETPVFQEMQKNKKQLSYSRPFVPILSIFQNRKKVFITIFSIGSVDGILCYTLFGFLNIYLSTYLNMPLQISLEVTMYGLISCMIFSPLMGAILDKVRKEKFFKAFTIVSSLSVYGIFSLMQQESLFCVIVAQILFGILTAGISGTFHAYAQSLFPPDERYTGISFGFNLGSAIFGGTAPLILTYFVKKTENLYIPAMYISLWLLICFFCISRIKSSNFKEVR